jgi:hypothetical protein
VVDAFLASDLADYITGTSIYIDGGMMLYPGCGGAVEQGEVLQLCGRAEDSGRWSEI